MLYPPIPLVACEGTGQSRKALATDLLPDPSCRHFKARDSEKAELYTVLYSSHFAAAGAAEANATTTPTTTTTCMKEVQAESIICTLRQSLARSITARRRISANLLLLNDLPAAARKQQSAIGSECQRRQSRVQDPRAHRMMLVCSANQWPSVRQKDSRILGLISRRV